jgi:hypothetical protein
MSIGVLGFALALLLAGALVALGLAAWLVMIWQRWAADLTVGDFHLSADEHRELLAAAVQRHAAKWAGGPLYRGESLTGQGDELVDSDGRRELVGQRATPVRARRVGRRTRRAG